MAAISTPAPAETVAPSPFAMLCLGATASVFGLSQTGLLELEPGILGAGLFYGGLGLLFSGMADWRHNNPFGAVIGIAYGLFWLSLMGMIMLPATGFGHSPGPAAMGSYLAMWGLFSALLFSAGHQAGRPLQLALGLLLACLLLLAVGELCAAPVATVLAGWAGLAAGLVAGHSGLGRLRRWTTRHATTQPRSTGTP